MIDNIMVVVVINYMGISYFDFLNISLLRKFGYGVFFVIFGLVWFIL